MFRQLSPTHRSEQLTPAPFQIMFGGRVRTMKTLRQRQKSISAIFQRVTGAMLALVTMLAPAALTGSVQAQTFTLLYAFTGGTDGRDPIAGLIMDAQGNLYGAAAEGGNPACLHGCGAIFKLDTTGKETVLYSFTGGDGNYPATRLVRDAQGNLYGTTEIGAAFGYGTVFKLDPFGNETILHSFAGGGAGRFSLRFDYGRSSQSIRHDRAGRRSYMQRRERLRNGFRGG